MTFFVQVRIRVAWMTVLIYLNPIVDCIIFFIVYREKWFPPRSGQETVVLQEEFNGRGTEQRGIAVVTPDESQKHATSRL